MAKVKIACKSCSKEVEREEKPAPKNNKEAKQILFNCPSCKARNLRDGSAVMPKKKIEKPVKPVKDTELPIPVAPVIKPVKPVKHRVKNPVTREPVNIPVDRSETHGEESENSPVIIQ